ncbi:MAG: ATPase V, partial [Erysipelotrichaceae bacterium]|nr:ATPase V [Erysipelotrichaceae bacterium]
MAIVKMKFVEASTDRDHLDSMLLKGIGSGMLDVEPASNIVTEDNGGKMISEENPYADYRQTLQNFAHAVGFSFDPDRKPSRTYSKEEIEKFLGELNEKFGITSDAGEVILTH